MKRECIGCESTLYSRLKQEYRFVESKDIAGMVFIDIYTDKRYGVRAELSFDRSITQHMFSRISKKVRSKLAEGLQKKMDEEREGKYKPVDTSKWVKPDEESIRRELAKRLIMQEILKEQEFHLPMPCSQYIENRAKADLCYSILHSHFPYNPQGLTNFAMLDVIEIIITEMKGSEYKNIIKRHKNLMKDKRPIEILREEFQKWRAKCAKNMIVLNSKPVKKYPF